MEASGGPLPGVCCHQGKRLKFLLGSLSVCVQNKDINSSPLCMFQFAIVGTFGETDKTDVAIDAICVLACKGEVQNQTFTDQSQI